MHFTFIAVVFAVFGHCFGQNHPWDAHPGDANWLKRHESLVQQTQQHAKEERIAFIGDSITDFWASNGRNVWNKYYAPRHAFNYGISGDRTENVVYRIENKEFDGVTAKVAVLMIGTNNLGANTIEDIAHGVKEILTRLEAKMPTTKIILLAVLPRGADASKDLGLKAKQLNVLIEKFADNSKVFWLDMWNSFAETNGHLKPGLFIDNLHPTEKGYEVWYETMEPLLKKLDPAF